MIEIAIDEEACVSCTLCAEICPTDVFTFDETKGVPDVAHPKECFGCLSCSEICPSNCIEHGDVQLAESYYHDPYALRMASRMAVDRGADRFNTPRDAEHRDRALEDLGVRLLSVAEVFERTLGGSLPAVGTMAGRTLARHLPRYRGAESLEEALEMTERQLSPAWEVEHSLSGDQLELRVSDCFVREVCQREGLELGGGLCILFYNYLAGYLGKLAGRRLRLKDADRGAKSCAYTVQVFE